MRRWGGFAFALALVAACNDLRVAEPSDDAGTLSPDDHAEAGSPSKTAPSDAGRDLDADAEAAAPRDCAVGNEFPSRWTKRVVAPSTIAESGSSATFTVTDQNPSAELSIVIPLAPDQKVSSLTCTFHVTSSSAGKFDFVELSGTGGAVRLFGGVEDGVLAVRDDHVGGPGCDEGVCTIVKKTGDAVSLGPGLDFTFKVADMLLEIESGEASAVAKLAGSPSGLLTPEVRVGIVSRSSGPVTAEISEVCCNTTL